MTPITTAEIEKLFREYPLGKQVWVLDRYLGTIRQGEIVKLHKIHESLYITVRCGHAERDMHVANAPGIIFDTKAQAYAAAPELRRKKIQFTTSMSNGMIRIIR